MRFLLFTPGTGSFFCGSCLRDNALGSALRALGHDVTIAPLYLPMVLEEPNGELPVHMGGINMYLQQKTRVARLLPRPLADLLDSPRLLRWASKQGSMTAAPDLGAMTVSMLRGEQGRQVKEVDKLADWVGGLERPDVIVLSNMMLCGIVHRLREVVDCPIVVTMQGEAPFLDGLPAPFAEQAWAELRQRAAEVDAFVAVSRWYGDLMRERLELDADRVTTIHNGIDVSAWSAPRATEARPAAPPTIGYLARMCADKGLPTLVDAFVALAANGRVPNARLRVAGVVLKEDEPLVAEQRAKLAAAGLDGAVEFLPNVTRADKLAFLETLDVLSVPATYGESFGLYVLEALAAGVPVVQPRHAAFPELLDATGGAGLLCDPDDPAALAASLEELLVDRERAAALGRIGREAVFAHFTAERMATEFASLCERSFASSSRAGG